jgi:hypothetical protein
METSSDGGLVAELGVRDLFDVRDACLDRGLERLGEDLILVEVVVADFDGSREARRHGQPNAVEALPSPCGESDFTVKGAGTPTKIKGEEVKDPRIAGSLARLLGMPGTRIPEPRGSPGQRR